MMKPATATAVLCVMLCFVTIATASTGSPRKPWPADIGHLSFGNHLAVVTVPAGPKREHENGIHLIYADIPTLAAPSVGEANEYIVRRVTDGRLLTKTVATRPRVDTAEATLIFEDNIGDHDQSYEVYLRPYEWSGGRTSLAFDIKYLVQNPQRPGVATTLAAVDAQVLASPINSHWATNVLQSVSINGDNMAELQSSKTFVHATVTDTRARSEFDAVHAMEVAASPDAVTALFQSCSDAPAPPSSVMVIPEDRLFAVRMKKRIPSRWAPVPPFGAATTNSKSNSCRAEFQGSAAPGEFYVFQVAVVAVTKSYVVEGGRRGCDVSTLHRDDTNEPSNSMTGSRRGSPTIDIGTFRPLSLQGIDISGTPFEQSLTVAAGEVGVIWVGGKVPTSAAGSVYVGELQVNLVPRDVDGRGSDGSTSRESIKVSLRLEIGSTVIADNGDGELWRLSRLAWLDSTIGLDGGPTYPYTSPTINKSSEGGPIVQLLGKSITVAPGHHADQDQHGVDSNTFYLPLISSAKVDGFGELLDSAIALSLSYSVVDDTDSAGNMDDAVTKTLVGHSWTRLPPTVTSATDTTTTVSVSATNDDLLVAVTLTIEFDGYVDVHTSITSQGGEYNLDDIVLSVPLRHEAAQLIMGLNQASGRRAPGQDIKWSWHEHIGDGSNLVWLGSVGGGLRVRVRGDAPEFQNPLHVLLRDEDISWGGGHITVTQATHDAPVHIKSNTGPVTIAVGENIVLRADLMMTPVKPLNASAAFGRRYYQYGYNGNEPPAVVASVGANVYNVHQGVPENPYINVPFEDTATERLSALVNECRRVGIDKVKMYYTMREISTRCAELWALRSLPDEIFVPGRGGGAAWLREHLGDGQEPGSGSGGGGGGGGGGGVGVGGGYSVAWAQDLKDGDMDLAVHTTGTSRYTNMYLHGLDWILSHPPAIDGIYLDEMAFGRSTMLRLRRSLDKGGMGREIDVHSCNKNVCPHDAKNTIVGASSLLIYMTHLPYTDRLWLGEAMPYRTASPEEWLVEMSGIPFGLMSDGLNLPDEMAYRGLLHGMANRPFPGLWRLFIDASLDEVGTQVHGYWEQQPVAICTSAPTAVFVTVIANKVNRRALIVAASWSDSPIEARIDVDWSLIGFAKKRNDKDARHTGNSFSLGIINVEAPQVEATSGMLLQRYQPYDDPMDLTVPLAAHGGIILDCFLDIDT